MSLPEQVQKQVDAARSIIEQHYGPQAGATDPATDAAQEGTDAAVAATESAAPAATPQDGVRPQENSATPAEDENSPTYAQRWRSLQGVYNATKQQLDSSANRIANLEQLVSTMQSAPVVHAQQPAARQVTETDVSEYGSDMVDFARRVAREEMGPIAQTLSDLNRRIEQLSGMAPVVHRVAANQQVNAEQAFADRLTRAVPDWGRINDSPEFHNWLLTPDSMTGILRQTYLADAEQTLDLDRVVSIFQAWKREAGVTNVQPGPTPTASAAASKLEKQVAPGRASAATSAPSQKAEKQYTPADIKQFFAAKLRGEFKGREAEAQATERDIFLAQREGRVVQSAA